MRRRVEAIGLSFVTRRIGRAAAAAGISAMALAGLMLAGTGMVAMVIGREWERLPDGYRRIDEDVVVDAETGCSYMSHAH